MTIRESIENIKAQTHLTREEARAVMQQLLSGSVPDEEIVVFLAALRDKGEQADELVGFAEEMRAHAAETLRAAGVKLKASRTGSPCSTPVAPAAMAAGRSTFRRRPRWWRRRRECGWPSTATARFQADAGAPTCWRPWGWRWTCRWNEFRHASKKSGMVFLLAPRLHLAMKHVMNARRALKTKSVFNLLGPLTNPLAATIQLVGVFDAARTEMMAETLRAVGTEQAYVVAGSDGIDEITTTGPTRLSSSTGKGVETRDVQPEEFDLPRASLEQLHGGDAATNARLLLSVLEGERSPLSRCGAGERRGGAHPGGKGAKLCGRRGASGRGAGFRRRAREAPRARGIHERHRP